MLRPWMGVRPAAWSPLLTSKAGSVSWLIHTAIGLLCCVCVLAICFGALIGSSWEARVLVCTICGIATSLWLASHIAGPLRRLEGRATALAMGEALDLPSKQGFNEVGRASRFIHHASLVQRALLDEASAQTKALAEAISRNALHADCLSQRTEFFAAELQEVTTSMEQIQGQTSLAAEGAEQLKADFLQARDALAASAESVSTCTARLGAAVNTWRHVAARVADLQDLASRGHQAVIDLSNYAGHDSAAHKRAADARVLLERTVAAAGEAHLLLHTALAALQRDHRSFAHAEPIAVISVSDATQLADLASAVQARLSEQSKRLAWAHQALELLDAAAQRNAGLVEEARSTAVTIQVAVDQLVLTVNAFGGVSALPPTATGNAQSMPISSQLMPK